MVCILHLSTTVFSVGCLQVAGISLVVDDHAIDKVPSLPGELYVHAGKFCFETRQIEFDDVEPAYVTTLEEVADTPGVPAERGFARNVFVRYTMDGRGLSRDWHAWVDPVAFIFLTAVRVDLKDG